MQLCHCIFFVLSFWSPVHQNIRFIFQTGKKFPSPNRLHAEFYRSQQLSCPFPLVIIGSIFLINQGLPGQFGKKTVEIFVYKISQTSILNDYSLFILKTKLIRITKYLKEKTLKNERIIFNPLPRVHLLILEKGRGRESDRNIGLREKYQFVASRTCSDWGPSPQCGYLP